MNITFPPNPNTGDTFTAENGVIYTYDGTKWVAVGTGGGTVPISTGNIGFSGDAIYDLNGMVIENADLTHGATAAIIIPANGSTSPVQVNNTYGDITLGTGNNASITAIYTFGKTGNITLPSNSSNINYANGVSILSGLGGGGNYGNSNVATFLASFGSNVISTTGNITAGFVKGDGSQLTNLPAGNYSNSNVVALLASFGSNSISTSGNVTATNFVGNIPAADGNGSVQLNVNGYLGAAAGFNYSGNTLYSHTASFSGEPDSGINGLYTGVPGFTILGSSVMTQVTGNVIGYSQTNFQNISDSPVASGDYIITSDNGTDSTHFIDLGITSSTWDGSQENSLGNTLSPGDGYLYVQDGNLALAVKDGIDQHVWYFDNTGNLTFPDNSGSGWPVNTQRFGMGNIGAWLDGQWTIGEFSGNSVSGEFGIRIDPAIEGPVGMTFPASASSNTQPVQIYSTNGGGISLTTGGPEWTFDSNGDLTAPGDVTGVNLVASDSLVSPQLAINLTNYNWSDPIVGITLGANTIVTLANNVFGDPYSGQVTIEGVNGTTQANGNWWYVATNPNEFELFQDAEGTPVDSTSWTTYTDGGLAFTLGYANIEINAQNITIRSDHGDYANKIWSFNRDGSTVFPTLTVDLHNGGTQTGQTLQFGDPTQQAIITGPTPAVDNNAQRLIIQGQRGNGTGEGGDVYLWAGDAENNGGDIKIYAGDADAGNVGDLGGYVNIDGGGGYTRGGQVEITGGYSSSGDGGYVNLNGGYGTNGGNIGISAGYGQAGPGGAVTIQGGGSNNGLAEYGNVGISAGASSWAFDNTGNLTLPQGGIVYETNIPFGGLSGKTIALKPYGGTDIDQQLLVYPTAGADFNHLHLTTGNLWNTELFLGNDDFYVKLANTGNVVINTNNNGGNTAQWTFDTTGAIAASGDLTLQTPNGVPGAVTAITGSSGSWESNPVTNLATTGGTGTGLTVNVTETGGYASAIAIATPGTGYRNGDAITVTSGSSSATFTISVLANNWTFGTDGNFSLNGSNIAGSTTTVVNDGINSIALSLGAQMDVYGFPFSGGGVRGQLTITGDITTTEALGTWYYQSINTYIYQLYTDSTYSTLVDASGWTPYTGGGVVYITKQSPASNVVINSNGYFSTFGNDGQVTLPGTLATAGDIGTDGNVYASGNVYTGRVVNGGSGMYIDAGYPGYINFFNSVGTTVTINDAGNINGGNISASGNVTAGNLSVSGATNISNVTINSYTSVPQTWFKGAISAPQNIVSSTDTVTLWNSNSDPLGWGNVTTGHITPNKAGWYEITSRVQFNTNAAANAQNQINHQIAVNGNQQAISQLPNLTGNVPVTMVSTAMVELNGTTDYITTTSWSSVAGNAQQINGGNTAMILVRWVSGS